MPITHTVDYSRGHVHIVVTGDFTLQDIGATVSAVARDPLLGPGFTVLSDHRKIAYAISPLQLVGLLALLEEHSQRFASVRWAIVSGGAPSYSMMRLLAASAELAAQMDVQVFLDIDLAERWLAEGEGHRPA